MKLVHKNYLKGLALLVMMFMLNMNTGRAQQNAVQFQDLTFKQAQSVAKKDHKIILVDVGSSRMDCKPCKEVEGSIFTRDSIAQLINDNCISIKMDMSSEQGKEFAKKLVMLMYPVYVFYDENGNQLDFIKAGLILKDPIALTGKVRASMGIAKRKRENTRSIEFDDDNWKAILAKAKEKGEMVFLDAYTSWCRPCMRMKSDIFTLNKVADFYNDHFINVSMDMEKGIGPKLVQKYGIQAYPTFLYIDGNGNLLHRGGGYQGADSFIKLGQEAVDSK